MMPHHFKLLLVALAFPLVYILGYWTYEHYQVHWRTPLVPAADKTRIQFPNYHLVALDALAAFNALPANQQQSVRDSLEAHLVDFKPWVSDFAQAPPQVICLGENHNDHTRLFLAKSFFTLFKPDVLMIESTADQHRAILQDQRSYVPLLNADIRSVLDAQSKSAQIVGIEQTEAQKSISREQALFQNFKHHLQQRKTNLVLIGALHCGDFAGWFYDLLIQSPDLVSPDQRTSLRVLGEHQDGSLEAFIYFLDEIGFVKKHFTITQTKTLAPWLYKTFPVFYDQTLKHYDAVLVFRPG